MAIELKSNPFYLSDEDVSWVQTSLASMTTDEKINQLFCSVGLMQTDEQLAGQVQKYQPGGFMFRPVTSDVALSKHRIIQSNAKIPMLLAANLEAGGSGIAIDGTAYGKPLQCAATGDYELEGYRLGKVSCAEGAAVGCNMSFAPIVDIDMNFRNPITNIRTFGDDPERVYKMARGYLKAAKEHNIAACIKHFPGDGVDERDQHLLTSVNSLDEGQWMNSFGMVYGNLIRDGVPAVMVGHISQPAMARALCADISPEEAHLPATLSSVLLGGLLRERLGFNGLIITDASGMLGLSSAMPRSQLVPSVIAAGCDMFLFTKNEDEDHAFMRRGYDSGILSDQRLNDAVTRILALKASLGLHKKMLDNTLVPGENTIPALREVHQNWAAECADKAVTLVKNRENLLPLSPQKTKRIYLNVMEESDNINSPLRASMKALLEKEGFEVTVRDRNIECDMEALMRGELTPQVQQILMENMMPIEHLKTQYDLILYVANYETASNNVMVRLVWRGLGGAGNDYPRMVREIPTVFVSLANPYHLIDVPMIKTFINAYNSTDVTMNALMEKLMGRSEFTGANPVDPFCGRESTRL